MWVVLKGVSAHYPQVALALLLLDPQERILLQGNSKTRTWQLLELEYYEAANLTSAANLALQRDCQVSFDCQGLVGIYTTSQRNADGLLCQRLLIALYGSVDSKAAAVLDVFGRTFFSTREIPSVAGRVHLEILTDFLAGRSGVVK